MACRHRSPARTRRSGTLAVPRLLGRRPTLPPPKVETTPAPQRPATTEANPAAPPATEEQRPQDTAKSIPQRIAETTDRNELLLIAEAAPAHRTDVEARLIALGYLRLVKRDSVVWLRPGRDESFSEGDDCPEMIALPAATFLMGSPASEPGRQEDEG